MKSEEGDSDVEVGLEFMKTSPLNLIQPDTWYNIPICVVKAFQVLIGHGRAQDSYISELTRQVREAD